MLHLQKIRQVVLGGWGAIARNYDGSVLFLHGMNPGQSVTTAQPVSRPFKLTMLACYSKRHHNLLDSLNPVCRIRKHCCFDQFREVQGLLSSNVNHNSQILFDHLVFGLQCYWPDLSVTSYPGVVVFLSDRIL